MTDRHVDANAVAGILAEIAGREVTDQPGTCLDCGAVSMLGALLAYRDCPGDVLRCPDCGSVQLVIVELRGVHHVTLEAL